MNSQKGFSLLPTIVVVLLLAVLGGAYLTMNPANDDMNEEVTPVTKTSITWQYKDAGELDGTPHTTVIAVINGTPYETGTFMGSCSEIGTTGGIDSRGLLAGELSATQCWFAGGGNEVGVFAHEDGGFDIMVGELSEGNPGFPFFRGNFSVKSTVKI